MNITENKSCHSPGVTSDNKSSKPISGKLICRAGDCERIIKGVRTGEMIVHPNGKVTLFSHEKAQKEIKRYQEMLKERPDCSNEKSLHARIVSHWKEGLLTAVDDFSGGVLKTAKKGNKISERLALGPKETNRIMQRVKKCVKKGALAYDIGHAAFKGLDAMWDHERQCTYFRAIEARINNVKEASTVPIAWMEMSKKPKMHSSQNNMSLVRIWDVNAYSQEKFPRPVPPLPPRRPLSDSLPLFSPDEHQIETKVLDKLPESQASLNQFNFNVRFAAVDIKHPRQASVNLECRHQSGVGVGAQVPLDNPKAAVVTGNTDLSNGFDVGVSVPISDPKNTTVNMGADLGDYRVGVAFRPRKPLKSHVSASFVVPIYGVPVRFGVDTTVRRPENARLTAAIPLGPVDLKIADLKVKHEMEKFVTSITNPKKAWKHETRKAHKVMKKIRKTVRKLSKKRRRKRKKRKAAEREQERLALLRWEHQVYTEALERILVETMQAHGPKIGALVNQLEAEVAAFPEIDDAQLGPPLDSEALEEAINAIDEILDSGLGDAANAFKDSVGELKDATDRFQTSCDRFQEAADKFIQNDPSDVLKQLEQNQNQVAQFLKQKVGKEALRKIASDLSI